MGHMQGNLQIFLGPDVINAYAYKLHHLLPATALWAVRLVLFGLLRFIYGAAITLTLDNRKARPQGYEEDKVLQASYSSRTMRMSGIILMAFIIFHIAHFTVRIVPGKQYEEFGVLEKTMVPLVRMVRLL